MDCMPIPAVVCPFCCDLGVIEVVWRRPGMLTMNKATPEIYMLCLRGHGGLLVLQAIPRCQCQLVNGPGRQSLTVCT